MSTLTLIAQIYPHPDKVEHVKQALKGLIAPTRAEDGCLRYELHQDNEDPTHFLFYEEWSSRETWLAHMASPHLKEYIKITEGMIRSLILSEMTQVTP